MVTNGVCVPILAYTNQNYEFQQINHIIGSEKLKMLTCELIAPIGEIYKKIKSLFVLKPSKCW